MYIVYGLNKCKFCIIAKNLLKINNLDFIYRNLDTKSGKIPKYLKKMVPENHNTVPVIFYKNKSNIKFIGGASDLYFYLNK